MHYSEAIPSKLTGDRIVIYHVPFKRVFDLFFSLFALVAIFPICSLIFLSIKLTSKGPAIYGQTRIGRGGKSFKCFKFRTMYLNSEELLDSMLKKSPELQNEWNKYYKLKNDPRITKIGYFLRKTSLDELPQFWNVLKGDLSVVGPRPVTEDELKKEYGPYRSRFLSVRPGLTGPWQVSGRNNLPYSERVKIDLNYINNRTFFWDLLLIFRTIPVMIWPNGAY